MILTGSGTLAMEALVKNLFAPGERVLVPVYGKFSERFYEIALEAGLVVERLDYPYGDTPRPEDVAKEGYAGLLLVHSETSTGALADLPALARAFKEKNPEGLVGADMVTSLLVGRWPPRPWAWTPRPRGARRASCAPRASASWPSPPGPWSA